MKTLKQNFKSNEAEDRQEELKNADTELDKCRERKFRKHWGTGHTGKKWNIRRASHIDSHRERTLEER